MLNFNDFKFEVIDLSVKGTPDLYINLNGLTFSKKTVEDMSYPAFIRPLIDVEHKAFAIQACKQTDDRAIKFSKPRAEQINGISVQAKLLLHTVRTIMEDKWHAGKRYRIIGIHYPEAKAMVFDLNSALELPALRKAKKEAE